MCRTRAFHRRMQGFTVVEMAIVIAVIGILGGMSVGFVRSAIASYVSTEQNVKLADRADLALRRMHRDVRNALPNSVRVTANGANSYLEFIPIRNGGRYRAGTKADGSGDPLNFSGSDSSFDVLGAAMNVSPGSQLVINNLGIDGADVYEGSNVSAVSSSGGSLTNLAFSAKAFGLGSPNHRFFLVGTASSFVCDVSGGRLLYYPDYTIQSSQPNSLATLNTLSTPHVVVDGVTACSIDYAPGVLQRSGVVTIVLQLSNEGGRVQLVSMLNVVNTP